MNIPFPSFRSTMLIGFLATLAMMGLALFFQHYLQLEPCPLCILQRIIVISLGIVFLIAFLHHPAGWGRRVYGLVLSLVSLTGLITAARHTWLQHLPAESVPECGPSIDFLLRTLPPGQVIQKLFQGSGQCAEVVFSFLGLSIPEMTLLGFSIFFLYGLKLSIKGA